MLRKSVFRYYSTKTVEPLNEIKSLFNEGRRDDALRMYFKRPNPSAATFLILQQTRVDLAFRIYHAVKKSKVDICMILALIAQCKKGNQRQRLNNLLNEAMNKFNQMTSSERHAINVNIWCMLTAELCHNGRIKDSMKLIDFLKHLNAKFSEQFYLSMLTACGNNRLLDLGKWVHSHLLQSKLKQSIALKNSLIYMYSMCGSLEKAIEIFNKIPASMKNTDSWNMIISAYGQQGKGEEAFNKFQEMLKEEFQPNSQTFTCIINACGQSGMLDKAAEIFYHMQSKFGIEPEIIHYRSMLVACAKNKSVLLGKEIYDHLAQNGYKDDVTLQNCLINVYAKCDQIEEALKIFNSMSEKDVVSWTIIISALGANGNSEEALKTFDQMIKEGFMPDDTAITCILDICGRQGMINDALNIFKSMETRFGIKPNKKHYTCLLRDCADNKLLELGKWLHEEIVKNRCEEDAILKNCLINMYAKCGQIEQALKIFDSLNSSEKNIAIWTTIISAYGENGKAEEAYQMFQQMVSEGFMPNEKTITCILEACASDGNVETAVQIVSSMEREYGIKPNAVHYSCLLTACADNKALELGKWTHHHLVKNHCHEDIILKSCLVNMYAKCGCFEDALTIFNKMDISERNTILWNTLISSYGQHGKGDEALHMFQKMLKEGVKPDEKTICFVLNACSNNGLIDAAIEILDTMEKEFGIKPAPIHYSYLLTACADKNLLEIGKWLHQHLIRNGCDDSIVIKNCLIYMYAKCGQLDEALKIFHTMPEKDTVTWNTIISIFGEYGKNEEAFDMFQQMQKEGFIPDDRTTSCISKILIAMS